MPDRQTHDYELNVHQKRRGNIVVNSFYGVVSHHFDVEVPSSSPWPTLHAIHACVPFFSLIIR